MYDILIKNASVINEGCITQSDVAIMNGRIAKIASSIDGDAKKIIDLEGDYLAPGMIDDQVHFREPGLTHKGEIATESKAAIAGGVTSYMEMPNVNPQTVTLDALEEKYARASGKSYANYAFYLGATNDNVEQIERLNPNQACGVKVFMGSSTGNMLVDDEKVLEKIFSVCPVLIATHCEDTPMISENEAKMKAIYGEHVPMELHGEIRSREACYKSSSFAVDLAKKTGANLHVLHLTTAEELKLFTAGDIDHKKITAEVCVHHLTFDQKDYYTLGSLIKCNPSVKLESDKLALRKALQDNVLDIIATDHAPHTFNEKRNSYFNAPSGLPLVQHAYIGALQLVSDGILTLPEVVRKITHNVAIRYGVKDRGYVREGYIADLVVIKNEKHEIKRTDALYKCEWTPFSGMEFDYKIEKTILSGELVAENGKVICSPSGGRIEFDRV